MSIGLAAETSRPRRVDGATCHAIDDDAPRSCASHKRDCCYDSGGYIAGLVIFIICIACCFGICVYFCIKQSRSKNIPPPEQQPLMATPAQGQEHIQVGGRRPSTIQFASVAAMARHTVRIGHGPRRRWTRNARVGSAQRPNGPGDRPAGRRPGPVLHSRGAGRGARGDGSGHGRGIGVSTDRAAKAR